MAVIHYSHKQPEALRRRTSAPVEVLMLETSGQLGLLCAMHLIGGMALWTSVVAAVLLWAALNSRSLQEADATLAQRFFGLRLDTSRPLSQRRVLAYAFVMGGLGIFAWILDNVVSARTDRSMTYRITECSIEPALEIRGFGS